VTIAHSGQAFDGDDRLVDDASKALIRELLDNLVRWTRQMRK
jgi:hypothetical protein